MNAERSEAKSKSIFTPEHGKKHGNIPPFPEITKIPNSSDEIKLARDTFLGSLDSYIASDINILISIIQNTAESLTTPGSFIDGKNVRHITSEYLNVQLIAVSRVSEEKYKRIKKYIGDKEHVSLVLGTVGEIEAPEDTKAKLVDTIHSHLIARDAILTNKDLYTHVIEGTLDVTNPYQIFSIEEFNASEKLYTLSKTESNKESTRKTKIPDDITEGDFYTHIRVKGVSNEKYHSLFIIKPTDENATTIHVWIANTGLGQLLNDGAEQTIAEFKPFTLKSFLGNDSTNMLRQNYDHIPSYEQLVHTRTKA